MVLLLLRIVPEAGGLEQSVAVTPQFLLFQGAWHQGQVDK